VTALQGIKDNQSTQTFSLRHIMVYMVLGICLD